MKKLTSLIFIISLFQIIWFKNLLKRQDFDSVLNGRLLMSSKFREKYKKIKSRFKNKLETSLKNANSLSKIDTKKIISKAFTEFRSKFKKKYKSLSEFRYRLKVFLKNKEKIVEHNLKKLSSFSMKVNEFSDLKWIEFKNNVLMNISPALAFADNFKYTIPFSEVSLSKFNSKQYFDLNSSDVDWNKFNGSLPQIMFQGECGSCYAFSSTYSISNAIWRKTHQSVKLSVQEIISCSSKNKYHNQGCNGGFIDSAMRYAIEKGISEYDSFPYIGKVSECKPSK